MHFLKSDLLTKKILLFGAPTLLVGLTGLYYVYRLYRNTSPKHVKGPQEGFTEDGPLDIAIALKNRGNKYFKGRKYAQAIECYTEALAKCPVDATPEIATFYQNRAAALENLSNYAKAIEDCTAALELSPKYVKALNRRARLFERLDSMSECLLDVTACCLLERFQNSDNVVYIDKILQKIGEQMAIEEGRNLSHTLPSSSFIRNYLGAFAWNPFTVASTVTGANHEEVAVLPIPTTALGEQDEQGHSGESEISLRQPNGETEILSEETFDLPEKLVSAYEALDKSLELMDSEIYEASMKWAVKAIKDFNSAPKVELADFAKSKLASREHPVAARARALLIDATYKTLRGLVEESKTQLSLIGEEMYADPMVRVNALIKTACLAMTIDKNISGSLYTFQQAQTLAPECPDVYLHRGQVNLLAEKLDEALSDLNEAVKLKPDFSVAQAQLLYTAYRIDMNAQKMEKAELRVKQFKKLTQKYPTCLETHSLYAQVLLERDEFEEADKEFERVIELAPQSGMAYAHRSLLQMRWHQDHNAAIKLLHKGIEVDPNCDMALQLLGQLSTERGDFEEALNYFNRSIQHAKSPLDLTHLISLREGVKAQMTVCKKYQISITEVMNSLKQEFMNNTFPM